MDKIVKERSENYGLLDAQTSQQIMKLDNSWKATFKGIKERRINPEKFNGQVRLHPISLNYLKTNS